MTEEKRVNKIPTIRGTDIMHDSRLNKVRIFDIFEEEAAIFTGKKPRLFRNEPIVFPCCAIVLIFILQIVHFSWKFQTREC